MSIINNSELDHRNSNKSLLDVHNHTDNPIDDDDDADDDVGSPRSEANRLINLVDQRQKIHQDQLTGITQDNYPPPLLTHRAKSELSWNQPHFSLLDDEDNDRDRATKIIIDAQRSFAPASPIALLFRGTWLVASLSLLHLHFKLEHFKYLTTQSLAITIVYQLITFGLSLYSTDYIGGVDGVERWVLNRDQQRPPFIICFVWIIYSIAIGAEFLVMVAYWTLEYDGNVSFSNLYRHLFIGFILLFDGNVVGRIPLRLKHIFWFYIYEALYTLWTIIYAHWRMGYHDGIIYPVLDWNNHPKGAGIVVGCLAIVAVPIIFLFCWLCSLWSKGCTFDGGRRLYREVHGPDGTDSFDEEEVLFDDNNLELVNA